MSIAQSILANPEKYSLEQLKQGVENGVIPAYIGVPIIQEMLQKQSQASAAGGQQMPPVMDQVMAQASQGLETLPSNLPQEYAGGGIIAFSPGGTTTMTPEQIDEEIDRQSRLANQTQDPSRISNLRSFVEEYRGLMPEKDPRIAAYEASIMKTPEQLDARKKQDMNLALAQFGLGLLGSKSRTLAGGIGEAGTQALPAMQAAMLSRRTAEDAALKAQADLARGERAEGIAALQGGLGLYTEEQKRQNALAVAREQQNKKDIPKGAEAFAAAYVRSELAKGSTKSIDELTQEGYQRYPGFVVPQTIAGGAHAVTTAGQDVTRTGQEVQANIAALTSFNKALDTIGTPESDENRRLRKLDRENAAKGTPTNLAEDYKNTRVREIAENLLKGGPKTQAPSKAGPTTQAPPKATRGLSQPELLPGMPPGSTYGKKVPGRGTEVLYQGKVIGYAN